MAVIVTRAGKGSPLTNNEVDANFINLNTELGLKASAGANSDITSLSGLTGGISTADYLDIDTAATPAGAVGRLKWSSVDAGPEIGMGGGNVTLQLGQEELVYVLNKTGTAFTDMHVVRVVGAQGNRLEVALALADNDVNSASSLAVVTEPIANNQEGFATRGGLVRNVNTSAFAEGAALFLSPTTPGDITSTVPTAPDHAVRIGWCVRSHATVGSIYVHIQNGYELEELHNVLISTPTNDQVLQYESATSLWKNKTLVTLPSQTGNSGKFLTTDGTNASWATVDLTPYLAKSGGTMTGAITFAAGQTWPTFNQSTTGSAATLTTARTLTIGSTGKTFDGSANVAWTLGEIGAQATLVSATNIKTVNGNSLLGSGDLAVSASPAGSTTQVQYNSGGAFAGSANLTFNGTNLTCGGTVTANSDESLKANWRDLPIDFVDRLADVKHGTYDRTDMPLTQDGVSAQSLRKLLESSVLENEDGLLSVAYGNAALVSAIQLAKRLVALEATVAKLVD
jgi:hypothetical protein